MRLAVDGQEEAGAAGEDVLDARALVEAAPLVAVAVVVEDIRSEREETGDRPRR